MITIICRIAPYPSANAPAFNASDPMMAPPTYDDAVPKDFVNKFAKQEPYNPDFK